MDHLRLLGIQNANNNRTFAFSPGRQRLSSPSLHRYAHSGHDNVRFVHGCRDSRRPYLLLYHSREAKDLQASENSAAQTLYHCLCAGGQYIQGGWCRMGLADIRSSCLCVHSLFLRDQSCVLQTTCLHGYSQCSARIMLPCVGCSHYDAHDERLQVGEIHIFLWSIDCRKQQKGPKLSITVSFREGLLAMVQRKKAPPLESKWKTTSVIYSVTLHTRLHRIWKCNDYFP